MGKAAASEIETQITQNYFMSIPPVLGTQILFLDSFFALTLSPLLFLLKVRSTGIHTASSSCDLMGGPARMPPMRPA